MNPHTLGRLFALLTPAILFLAACQPATPGITNPPTETASALGSATPIKPTLALLQATPTSEGPALPPAGTKVPEGWQVFNDTTQGYSLVYPSIWGISHELNYSQLFYEIQKEPAGVGPPQRLYVSVYPKEYTDQDGMVFNFIPSASIQKFLALPVGEAMLKEPNAIPPDAWSYTRLPDQKVAGQTALVIEDSIVWEAPVGTKDRQVIMVIGNTTYILGMHYETPEQFAMFEQVLDSFQMIN